MLSKYFYPFGRWIAGKFGFVGEGSLERDILGGWGLLEGRGLVFDNLFGNGSGFEGKFGIIFLGE